MPVSMQYDVRALEKIQKLLNELPVGAKSQVIPAMNKYLMGGESGEGGVSYHGLKHYPAFVAHPGGQQFPQRTGRLQRGWRTVGEAYRQKITNSVPYAKWLHGDETQTWRAKFGNWRTLAVIVADNINGAMRAGITALDKWIKSKL
jgi:hypothetical protein